VMPSDATFYKSNLLREFYYMPLMCVCTLQTNFMM
jgi:hypothetical protein